MSLENKPEAVADTGAKSDLSLDQVIQDRLADGRREIDGLHLVPKDQTVGEPDVSTQGGSSISDNTDVAVLKVIEASTGRKFNNVEDASKYLKNLNGLVGDQEIARARKAAETLATWETKFGKQAPELEKLLADVAVSMQTSQDQTPEQPKSQPVTETKSQPTLPTKSNDDVAKRLEMLEHSTQLTSLEKKYPEATSVAEEIAIIAKSKGISYIEAYESSPLKQLMELKSKEESKKSPVVAPSNRTGSDFQKLENLGMKMLTKKASQADQVAFTKEYFKTRGVDI